MSSKLKAVLFDWDGVVVDSSRQHKEAWERMAAADGLPLPPDHFARSFGMRNPQIIMGMFHWTSDPVEAQRLADRKESLYRELVREQGLEALPGVRALLADLHAHGIPCAIASSTPRANLDAVLDGLALRNCFQAVVAAEDVVHGKPAPDVFLKAAQALGRDASGCVVFEDAHVGIAAGKAAGAFVVAVATTHPADTLGAADRVVTSLEHVSVAALRQWLA